jgi:hypothetical protein
MSLVISNVEGRHAVKSRLLIAVLPQKSKLTMGKIFAR